MSGSGVSAAAEQESRWGFLSVMKLP